MGRYSLMGAEVQSEKVKKPWRWMGGMIDLFSLFCFASVISTTLSSSLLICSSASYILLLAASSDFFFYFSYCILHLFLLRFRSIKNQTDHLNYGHSHQKLRCLGGGWAPNPRLQRLVPGKGPGDAWLGAGHRDLASEA